MEGRSRESESGEPKAGDNAVVSKHTQVGSPSQIERDVC